MGSHDNIYKGLFTVQFEFENLNKSESECLEECFINIRDNVINFNLLEIDGKVQPLDILVGLKRESDSIGNINIKIINKSDDVLGTVLFERVRFQEIRGFIDFDSNIETHSVESSKDINVNILYETLYFNGVKI